MSWLIRLFLAGFCVATLGSIAARDARADTRVALVVGNAKYEHADVLANTVNDAMAVSSVLKKAGFDVDERDNLTVVEFKRAVRDFARTAANADIAVVYYSGHGVEFDGTNYLIPTDARLANDSDVEDEAIPLDRVLAATRAAKKLSLIILDACRENPFLHLEGGMATKRVSFKGLVPLESTGTNTLVAYAAKAGSVSFDGSGANSPFTTALVKYIAEPGLDIRMALGKVRDEVLATTGNAQEPSIYGSLGGSQHFPGPGVIESRASRRSGRRPRRGVGLRNGGTPRFSSGVAGLSRRSQFRLLRQPRTHSPGQAAAGRGEAAADRDEAAADRGDKADHSCAGDAKQSWDAERQPPSPERPTTHGRHRIGAGASLQV